MKSRKIIKSQIIIWICWCLKDLTDVCFVCGREKGKGVGGCWKLFIPRHSFYHFHFCFFFVFVAAPFFTIVIHFLNKSEDQLPTISVFVFVAAPFFTIVIHFLNKLGGPMPTISVEPRSYNFRLDSFSIERFWSLKVSCKFKRILSKSPLTVGGMVRVIDTTTCQRVLEKPQFWEVNFSRRQTFWNTSERGFSSWTAFTFYWKTSRILSSRGQIQNAQKWACL